MEKFASRFSRSLSNVSVVFSENGALTRLQLDVLFIITEAYSPLAFIL
jgi:hypothetical protein